MTPEQLSAPSSPARQSRVLVADDDPRLLNMLADLLRERGFDVTEANSGQAAIDASARRSFELALLGLDMPGVDGFKVMSELQQAQPDCGVIVTSGETSFRNVSRALRRGALDYIRKPVDPEELLSIVEGVLGKQSLIRAHDMVQSRLESSESLHRYIVNTSPDIVFMLDEHGYICFINNKVEALLGYRPEELCGKHFRDMLDDGDAARGLHALQAPDISPDNPRVLEVRLKTRGNRATTRDFEITAFPVDPQTWPHTGETRGGYTGKPARYYGIARDVTERKEAEAFINFQAYHDLLTHLPNRTLFKDRLELAITHARGDFQKLAVMFLDLDRFKVINDTLGHAMGDRLLQAVTQRLEHCLRKGDTLSRFGGDEFTLLLPCIHGMDDTRQIALKMIQAFQTPFRLDDHDVFVGVSIGIAIYPDTGETMDLLIQNADIAMYHAKANGKDGYCFYSDTMSINSANRLSLERDLRLALDRRELMVCYQPQVCASSGRVLGLEALVRWQHPERGLLYPRDFLPLAEETGLIGKLSQQVLDQACHDAGLWIRDGHPDLRLAVNLSPSQVEHPQFVKTLLEQLQTHRFPAANLEIEITENVIMNDLDQISRKLQDLADTGIRIAIDDFGTGYSSLNYLHRLPIHTLKVDQSFVRSIRSRDDGVCIVNAIIAMAHGLKLEIVAEGVETDEQLHYLKRLGCHQVQGFYYGPAVPAAEIAPLLNISKLPPSRTG
ncbi:two-component system response regulator [Marinobacter fuscus]|uniref:cyclic-guanylate-specific phosphodiesterase n=1 Tax=Marinobacter fuscus TaxID=2109942 RepID=A0A2T1KKU4_9GAMM|nr:EAL domain-containing protein [Marinobacter fuscus]PSF10756.1 two-component system response regulator [Marinobacter fuscus]